MPRIQPWCPAGWTIQGPSVQHVDLVLAKGTHVCAVHASVHALARADETRCNTNAAASPRYLSTPPTTYVTGVFRARCALALAWRLLAQGVPTLVLYLMWQAPLTPVPCTTVAAPHTTVYGPMHPPSPASRHGSYTRWLTLQFQELPEAPEVNMRTPSASATSGPMKPSFMRRHKKQMASGCPWVSGALLLPGVSMTNGTWGPRAYW